MHIRIYTKMACFLACVISLFTSKPRNIYTPKRWKKNPPQPGHWFAWILWANARLEPLLCVSWQPGSRQCRCVDVSLTNVGESQMVAGGSCCLGIFFLCHLQKRCCHYFFRYIIFTFMSAPVIMHHHIPKSLSLVTPSNKPRRFTQPRSTEVSHRIDDVHWLWSK